MTDNIFTSDAGVKADRSDLAAAAQEYARQGFHIFPVRPGGKDPMVSGGFKAATTDLDTIHGWWTEWPTANIGVWPGGSNHVVFDVDVKADAGGEDSLAVLKLMYGDLPENAPVIETPSGGHHIWLTLPWDAELPGNKPADKGIDVRSANGYTILPPSRTDAGAYTARPGTPALSTPHSAPLIPEAWRTGALVPAKSSSRTAASQPDDAPDLDAPDLDQPEDIERAENFAANIAPPAIAGDRGNDTTYTVACRLRDLGLSQAEGLRIMDEIYNERCEPPWPLTSEDRETKSLTEIVTNAFRYAKAAPGRVSASHAEAGFAKYAQPADATATAQRAAAANDDGEDIVEMVQDVPCFTEAEVDGLEPPEWDIEDLLPRRALVALYGEPGSKKSFLALDWASHLARGWDWGGHEVDAPRRVLYVTAEGSQGLLKRLRAWRQHNGAEMTDNLTLSPKMPRAGDDDDWAGWVAGIKKKLGDQGADLIVFDTLAHLTVGLEENSNTQMMQAVSKLTHLRDDFAASVMVVHHTAKGGKELRGAGAVLGACDATFHLEKMTDGMSGKLWVRKQKDAETPQSYIDVTSHVLTVGHDHKGREMTSLALTAGAAQNPPTQGEKAETSEKVHKRETKAILDQYATNDDTPGPSPETKRPIADRARDALARITGHEAKIRDLAREIVRDEVGAEPPSHLVDCRRDDLRKYSRESGTSRDPELVALVSERDRQKRATRFELPPKTAA